MATRAKLLKINGELTEQIEKLRDAAMTRDIILANDKHMIARRDERIELLEQALSALTRSRGPEYDDRSPRKVRKFYLKDPSKLEEVDIGDWVEGMGNITSHSERDFVRRMAKWNSGVKESEATICYQCKHWNGSYEGMIVGAHCSHPDTRHPMNYVTGKEEKRSCRELNDGNCKHYEPKEKL